MNAALLYPTLHQMEMEGLLESRWEGEAGQRRRKIYMVTPAGVSRLSQEQAEWRRFFDQLFAVINPLAETRIVS